MVSIFRTFSEVSSEMGSYGLRKTSVRKDLCLIHERLKMGSYTAKAYSSSNQYLPWSVTIASIILFHVSTQANWWIQMLLKKNIYDVISLSSSTIMLSV